MTEPSSLVLAAYRHVLRATRIAFKGVICPPCLRGTVYQPSITGDPRLLISARHQARSSFALNSSLLPSSPEATSQIAHAEDVATILRQNVVQGQQVPQGGQGEKYSKVIPKCG